MGGRPKSTATIKAQKMREKLVNEVNKELQPILTAQLEAAKGLYYEKIDLDGVIRIYKEKPDINAARYLLDQAIGKAKESVELSGGIGLLVIDE